LRLPPYVIRFVMAGLIHDWHEGETQWRTAFSKGSSEGNKILLLTGSIRAGQNPV